MSTQFSLPKITKNPSPMDVMRQLLFEYENMQQRYAHAMTDRINSYVHREQPGPDEDIRKLGAQLRSYSAVLHNIWWELKTPELIMIAAMDQNGVIGHGDVLPWHNKDEMRHFRDTTMGFIVVMGRKTAESVKHLPGRLIFMVTQQPIGDDPDFLFQFDSYEAAVKTAQELMSRVFLAGGVSCYRFGIEHATHAVLSIMHGEYDGGVFWPSPFRIISDPLYQRGMSFPLPSAWTLKSRSINLGDFHVIRATRSQPQG